MSERGISNPFNVLLSNMDIAQSNSSLAIHADAVIERLSKECPSHPAIIELKNAEIQKILDWEDRCLYWFLRSVM